MSTDAEGSEPCRLLPWDSDFFGVTIAKTRSERLTAELCKEIDQWCGKHAVACLYFLARADDADTAQLAAERGFCLTDVRMTLEREVAADEPAGQGVRAFAPADLGALQRMARYSYRDSRFYFDPHFARERCDDLYELWTTQNCRGSAAAVLVAERQGQAVGYMTCAMDANHGLGAIELIGVETAWHRQGVGGELVRAAMAYFAAQKTTRVSVVTQGRNTAAQRLYQRCGFITRSVQLYFHKWYGR